MSALNPLVPSGYDIVWSVIALIAAVLMVVALVSLARSTRRLTSRQGLAWVLVVLLVPVAGPAAWLAIGRRAGMPRREA